MQTSPRCTPALAAEYERALARALIDWPTPGVQAAVLAGDDVIWTGAAGIARFEPEEPLTTRHLHRIGSITKLFTAHAVLALHDAGALDIDDPVSRWIPEFRPDGTTVTLRHILCHGSGIPAEGGQNVWESGVFPDEPEFRRMIASFQPVCAPMGRVKYSNAAFSMLGLVVASAAEAPYERVVHQLVLDPLGMRDTRFRVEDPDGAPTAQGHFIPPLQRRFEATPHQELRAFTPCGMLLSTPSDVLRLARAQWSAPALLSPALAAEARRLQLMDPEIPGWKAGYGLGWRQLRRGDRVYIGHSGAYLGHRCALEIACEDRVAAAVFSTVGGSDAPIDLAMDFVDAAVAGRSAEPTGSAPVPPDLQPLLGYYSTHRWAEAAVWYDGRRLVLRSTASGEGAVPLEAIEPGRLRVLTGRDAGEELVVRERTPDGTVLGFTIAGKRMRRI